jgi:hypothetical protein
MTSFEYAINWSLLRGILFKLNKHHIRFVIRHTKNNKSIYTHRYDVDSNSLFENEFEDRLIADCILLFYENGADTVHYVQLEEHLIYTSIIMYYYLTNVVDHDEDMHCLKYCKEHYGSEIRDKCDRFMIDIASSDAEWASAIRKKMMNRI